MSGTRVVFQPESNGVAWIRFESDNGVQLLSLEVLEQLARVVSQLEEQPPRIVVIAASGRTFLAGASLHELRAAPTAARHAATPVGDRNSSAASPGSPA